MSLVQFTPASVAAQPEPGAAVVHMLEQGRAWLVEAQTVREVKELSARAEAIRTYTRQADLGREAEDAACELRIRAERRIGQLLQQQEKAPAGRPPKEIGREARPIPRPPTLAEMGITKDRAAQAQALAKAPDETFDRAIGEAKAGAARQGISKAAVLRGVEKGVIDLDQAKADREARRKLAADWQKAGWPDAEESRQLGAYARLCRDLTAIDVEQIVALIRKHGDDKDRALAVAVATWIADLLEALE